MPVAGRSHHPPGSFLAPPECARLERTYVQCGTVRYPHYQKLWQWPLDPVDPRWCVLQVCGLRRPIS